MCRGASLKGFVSLTALLSLSLAHKPAGHTYRSDDFAAAAGAEVVACQGWPVDLHGFVVDVTCFIEGDTLLLAVPLGKQNGRENHAERTNRFHSKFMFSLMFATKLTKFTSENVIFVNAFHACLLMTNRTFPANFNAIKR